MTNRLLAEDAQHQWEFTFPEGVDCDVMTRAWLTVKRRLLKEGLLRLGWEPVLRAIMTHEDLYDVLASVGAADYLMRPNLMTGQHRLNGMLLAASRNSQPGHVVIELLSVRRVR